MSATWTFAATKVLTEHLDYISLLVHIVLETSLAVS
jgi:hypothetical protein